MVTKRYSRPDNVFCTKSILNLLTQCEVDLLLHPPEMDHFPIITKIHLLQEHVNAPPSFNFREADWDAFQKSLCTKLNLLPNLTSLNNEDQLNTATIQLTTAIQETIQENIRKTKSRPDARRWWNNDLHKMRRELNKLRAQSYKFQTISNHHSYHKLKRKSNFYEEAIIYSK